MKSIFFVGILSSIIGAVGCSATPDEPSGSSSSALFGFGRGDDCSSSSCHRGMGCFYSVIDEPVCVAAQSVQLGGNCISDAECSGDNVYCKSVQRRVEGTCTVGERQEGDRCSSLHMPCDSNLTCTDAKICRRPPPPPAPGYGDRCDASGPACQGSSGCATGVVCGSEHTCVCDENGEKASPKLGAACTPDPMFADYVCEQDDECWTAVPADDVPAGKVLCALPDPSAATYDGNPGYECRCLRPRPFPWLP